MCRLTLVAATAVIWLLASAASPANGHQAKAGTGKQGVLVRLERVAMLIAAQDLHRAESELNLLLKTSPQDPNALNLLGVIRVKQNRAGEAENLFKQALTASPRLTGARLNLGLLYLSTERVEEAVAEFEEALRVEPRHRHAQLNLVTGLRRLAVAALASGDREKALAHLLRAKAVAPADPDVLFEFGMVALGMTLYEDAAPAFVAALSKRPNEPKFLYALARARIEQGELADAERLFRRYVELRPGDATGHYGLGHVLALLKRGSEAAQSFHKSLELRPEQTESPYQLGLLAYASGDVGAAAAWFEKALSRYADHTGALLGMGLVHFSRKRYESARESLERVTALEPSLQKAHYYLSMTYARLGDKEAAQREAEIAATLERERKVKRRTILKLFEPGKDAPPAAEQKP